MIINETIVIRNEGLENTTCRLWIGEGHELPLFLHHFIEYICGKYLLHVA
jgi:hypothetical protein